MKQLLTYWFITLIALSGNAQTQEHLGEDKYNYVRKGMLIILSTKNYNVAKKFATEASKKLSIKIDLRGLTPNKQEGLTFSKSECEDNGWEYPCYLGRGRIV